MDSVTNAVCGFQIILTLVLSFSLKSFWNFFNVIQVLVYIRLFIEWPPVVKEIVQKIEDVVEMKAIYDTVFTYG